MGLPQPLSRGKVFTGLALANNLSDQHWGADAAAAALFDIYVSRAGIVRRDRILQAHRRARLIGSIGRMIDLESLLPVRGIDEHQPRHFRRLVAGEVLHIKAAQGMADQHVRRIHIALLEFTA